MRKEIVINVGLGETRAGTLEDGRLMEIYVEREDAERIVGNIYKGRVENVLPGMQAAFVDIGLERNAFLYVDDAVAYKNVQRDLDEPLEHPKYKTIKDLLKPGQQIVVQVTKEPMGTKGARVITHASLPGRYLVLMPTVEYIGISRRIVDEAERARLKAVAKSVKPKGMGLIVRTVAEGVSEVELAADCRFLVGMWETIQEQAKRTGAPALLYKDHDLVYRLVRDMFSADVDKFVLDDLDEYRKTIDLLQTLAPHLKNHVFLYHGGPSIFDAYNIEQDLAAVMSRKVWLESGGYLVIDRTEALTSIDVNTGRFVGSTNLADTVLRTNLEAAAEIARQLRLRDLGGIIIIDFIDMDTVEDERRVIERLEEELRRDKTKNHVLGFTGLGLVEMTRKKARQELSDILHKTCPYCEGKGRLLSEHTVASRVRREVFRRVKQYDFQAILIEAHPSVAAVLIGPGGSNLRELEEVTRKTIYIRGRNDLHMEAVEYATGTRDEVAARALPVHEGQIVALEIAEQHASNPHDGIGRLEGYVIDIDGAGDKVGERHEVRITQVHRTYAKAKLVSTAPQ
ncbi:MAG TPA: Rne/Rng family ribonuclease [Firmicutes bacterium]|nr:Rne/Rng family ribonuclease [Bacillota bacterium]